jgi:hypothetical protein
MSSWAAGWNSDWWSCGPCRSTSSAPRRLRRGRVAGVSLTKAWPPPAALTVRRRMSRPSSQGSRPASASTALTPAGSSRRKVASTRHCDFAGADGGGVGALAKQERERADEDGFAGAGFAGDDGEPRLECHRRLFDEGEVFHSQQRQHGRQDSRTGAGGEAGNLGGIRLNDPRPDGSQTRPCLNNPGATTRGRKWTRGGRGGRTAGL